MAVMRWLWKNKVHFLVLGVFVVYCFTASKLYATFFLKHGKPIQGKVSLPSENVEIIANIDNWSKTIYNGEEVYEVMGWVFAPGVPDSGNYQKKLVMHSAREDIFFQTEVRKRANLSEKFPQYNMELENAGFRVLISKDSLRVDNYKLGFILENVASGRRILSMVDIYIEREPNNLRLIGD